MHREYFYKDNRDYLWHQQVEIVEFEIKKVQRQLDLAMRKMHHLKQDLFYYVGMILGDLFVIFVCKYRKKLLVSRQISDDIKQFSDEICQRHSVIIRHMETDKDHIHYMIETEPTMSISKIVNLMKSYTTYHIWKRYPQYLRKQFWKEHTFWTDGYFACSVGNVSEEMLKRYIENQG